LRRAESDSIGFARICAVLAAILFVVALCTPLGALRTIGHVSESSLWSGPQALAREGLPLLGFTVLLALIALPAAKLVVELTVLFGMHAAHVPRWLRWSFGCVEVLSPWAMVDVFLLGSFVAYTRLRALAHIEVGLALHELGDREIERERRPVESSRPGTRPGLVRPSCETCGRVAAGLPGERCARCCHTLELRKANSLARAQALVLGAACLYVPANLLPVMTVTRLARGGPTTILHGVVELAQNHLWPLAIIVLLASIVVPVLKLVSLAAMLVMTHRRSDKWLVGRTRLFRFVRKIGRWSMIDVFMLSVLVGVVKLGRIATVLPDLGAGAFCAVVVLTMIATEAFDPRLMWDAARANTTVEEA
jgi:paraquat-inducible protein A